MKKYFVVLRIVCLSLLCSSCMDFLDVVPDNTQEIEHLFETKEKGYIALTNCYGYFPYKEAFSNCMLLAGDEYVGRLDPGVANSLGWVKGIKLMTGWQNANNPILGYWEGTNGATDLYEAIRACNIFLENINAIPDITDTERADWIAQVDFLKAYYHYFLILHYGPIIIADTNISPDEGIEAVRQYRQPVDSCFSYVLNKIESTFASLPDTRGESFKGQIDKTIAMAVKAKVWLSWASPFFNGNDEFYSTFLDQNGNPYFNLNYDASRWEKATQAADDAIRQATGMGGKEIYYYNKTIKFWDEEDYKESDILSTVYNHKYSIYDNWNNEIVWGFSNINDRNTSDLQTACNIRSEEEPSDNGNAWQWMAASYRMSERFYTKNGVPIEEDITFDYANRNKVTIIPDEGNYHKGVLQPLERTVKLHLWREPRFYAWLATDRGIWRTHDLRNNLKMRMNEYPGGKRLGDNKTDFLWTGIGIKKFVHPETRIGGWTNHVNYAFPLIRLADLFLMRAEASNEAYGPSQEVYNDLNIVRKRAGLPKIEDVWSDAAIVKNVGKHKEKVGLRDIIHTERSIELCFEGHRYYDVLRWKRADEFFISPIMGWDIDKSKSEEFYTLIAKEPREWQSPRNYLFPLRLTELTLNPNLTQNPGWN